MRDYLRLSSLTHQTLVELHQWGLGGEQNTYPQSMDYTDAPPK